MPRRSDLATRPQISPELRAALCDAIRRHPSMTTAAHSCGVSEKTLARWLKEGTLPGAPEDLAVFVREFLAANSKIASSFYMQAMVNVAEVDNPTAVASGKAMLAEVNRRFRDDDELRAILRGIVRTTNDLEAMLRSPTPRLRQALKAAGWVRAEDA